MGLTVECPARRLGDPVLAVGAHHRHHPLGVHGKDRPRERERAVRLLAAWREARELRCPRHHDRRDRARPDECVDARRVKPAGHRLGAVEHGPQADDVERHTAKLEGGSEADAAADGDAREARRRRRRESRHVMREVRRAKARVVRVHADVREHLRQLHEKEEAVDALLWRQLGGIGVPRAGEPLAECVHVRGDQVDGEERRRELVDRRAEIGFKPPAPRIGRLADP
mmetsp:Transcript_12798/g.33544  ORF Transcript_12798/g.33544 Transcript_12798/m.33544 type:complete len:227 (+) Transcript_12798:173-853(+)